MPINPYEPPQEPTKRRQSFWPEVDGFVMVAVALFMLSVLVIVALVGILPSLR